MDFFRDYVNFVTNASTGGYDLINDAVGTVIDRTDSVVDKVGSTAGRVLDSTADIFENFASPTTLYIVLAISAVVIVTSIKK